MNSSLSLESKSPKAPTTDQRSQYLQLKNEANEIEQAGTFRTDRAVEQHLTEIKKGIAAFEEMDSTYLKESKLAAEADSKIPFKFKFMFPDGDFKELVTNRYIVTHPLFGLDAIRAVIKGVGDAPAPTEAELKEYKELASSNSASEMSARYEILDTKITNNAKRYEWEIPSEYADFFNDTDVNLYLKWATAHLYCIPEDKMYNPYDLTDTTVAIKSDFLDEYLSPTDTKIFDSLAPISEKHQDELKKLLSIVQNEDAKDDVLIQTITKLRTEIERIKAKDTISSIRPMALFVKYMGNGILLGHKDEDGELVPGLIDFIRDIILYYADEKGMMRLLNYDEKFIINDKEIAAIRKWTVDHKTAEPTDDQIFGKINTTGLDDKEVAAKREELKELVGDESKDIYGLASYATRLNMNAIVSVNAPSALPTISSAQKTLPATTEKSSALPTISLH
jgi:hypothetical protein